jgi:Domain of unknown function (DUF4382)
MKKNHPFAVAIATILFTSIFFNACKKDNSANMPGPGNGQQNVSIYLADNPSHFFSHVYIDIQSVSLLIDTCSVDSARQNTNDCDHHNDWGDRHNNDSCNVWQDLGIQAGVYDVLDFRNGLDTLLAQGNVDDGVVKYIKISLGDSNSVVLSDSTTIPLHFHGWFDSTIYIPVGNGFMDRYASRHSRCWIDFDVDHSIIPAGFGFWLHPYFRCFTQNATGAIEGIVLPTDAKPVITAHSSSDTASAIPWMDGKFKIKGLQEGTYSLDVSSTNGYADTTIDNINVSVGKSVNVGTIKLHK